MTHLPTIEAFQLRHFNDDHCPSMALECPHGCDPIPLGDLIQLLELSILADDHIRTKHLPPPPPGSLYCARCYSLAASDDPWCFVCRGGVNE